MFCFGSVGAVPRSQKRKQLELQILSEPIQAWEGEDIKTLGNVIFMSQVMVQCGTSEVRGFTAQHHLFHLFFHMFLPLCLLPSRSNTRTFASETEDLFFAQPSAWCCGRELGGKNSHDLDLCLQSTH